MFDVVKLMYDTPWLSYSKVPIEVKDRWFNKWMESCYFEQGANPIVIRNTFDYRMGRSLQQMLRKHRSATNKVNRASAKGGSLYCGGSATIPSTQERMANEINRELTIVEVFNQTHTRKGNKEEWVDEQSERLNSAHEGNGSNSPVIVDPDEVWREVVGEPRKNRIYGIGSYFSRTLRTDPLLRSSRGTSEPPLSQHTMDELRTQIHGLIQELHQKAREELVREREEYRKMREEMAAYYASMRATGFGVGSTTVTAPAAQHDGDGRQEDEEDDADDYHDP
ncbi:hypothetical protein PIB30_056501 [Stylosanthes scabra]|uniref:Transposase n=1 Tax=Stylosanthes scabra TaxID=79078 RepID=A0ABU6VHL0_9FABA|nr:hypothetical protein [Stylosanthes scabra]